MVRIVNQSLATERGGHLSERERARALQRLARRQAANPLRRVRLECETRAVRDAVAVVGDRLWCENHADFALVVDVVE